MSKAINLPVDLPQSSKFRELRDQLALEPKAHGVYQAAQLALALIFTVFQELAYRAEAGEPIGLLTKKAIAGTSERLTAFTCRYGPDGCAVNYEWLQCLEDATWIVKQGDDYFCPAFKEANIELGEFSSKNAEGAYAKAFMMKARKLDSGEALQIGMNLLPRNLVDADGKELDSATVERLTRLIILCDKALGLGERQTYAFAQVMILNAVVVVRKYTNEQIDAVLKRVSMKRKHPVFNGMQTDRLLEKWEGVMADVQNI